MKVTKNNFHVGSEINRRIYEYNKKGNEKISSVKGKIVQVTDNLVVINNGLYNEAFTYQQFNREEKA